MGVKIALTESALVTCNLIAAKHAIHYSDADNTVLLSPSLKDACLMGFVGEWAVAKWLGVNFEALTRLPGRDTGVDVTARSGETIDVKTTHRLGELNVPKSQFYKIDPKRVDRFVLCWWRPGDTEVEIVRTIRTVDMSRNLSLELPGGPHNYKVSTYFWPHWIAGMEEL